MTADAGWLAILLLVLIFVALVAVWLKLDAMWRGTQPRTSRAQQRLDELGTHESAPPS